MSHQQAPNPDYSSQVPKGDLQPVMIVCRDCGDTELQFVPLAEVVERINRKRCDECQEQHDDEKRIAARATVNRALDMAILKNDETEVTCDSCSEPACFYDPRSVSASAIDGHAEVCEACGVHGKLYLHEPDGGDCFDASIRFRPYTAKEISAAGGFET